jgi:hypothetical protein
VDDVPFQLKDAADYLHKTPSGVRWLIDTGRLRAARTPSGQRIVWQSELEKYAAQ